MFCQNCGGKIEEGVKFCPGCGKAAGGASAVPIVNTQGAALQPRPMADEKYCFSCGAVIKKIAEICPKCGVSQSARNSIDKNLRTLVLVAIILLTIAPIISFFYWEILKFSDGAAAKGIGILWSVTYIGAFAIGIISFIKLRKNIGVALSNTLIILLGIQSAIEIFNLFRNIIGN
jgi:RNA polymerase subunit RPABC4/transcription elongation factor Spt4